MRPLYPESFVNWPDHNLGREDFLHPISAHAQSPAWPKMGASPPRHTERAMSAGEILAGGSLVATMALSRGWLPLALSAKKRP